MKSFFFSGLAGIATAIHKFTVEHFDKVFAWPVLSGLSSAFPGCYYLGPSRGGKLEWSCEIPNQHT